MTIERHNWRERQERMAAALRQRPCGLITDCDGTISPIARTPGQAGVDPRCRATLRELTRRLDLVAVVSGRLVENVRQMVGLDGIVYVGNHGLERWQDGRVILTPGAEQYRPPIAGVLDAARAELDGLGLLFENKGVAGGIHYRTSQRPQIARKAILSFVTSLAERAGLRLVEGKHVVELRPPLDVDKGTAVLALAADYRLRGGLYFGDDRSDVPALRAMRRLRQGSCQCYGIAVVGPEAPSALLAACDFVAEGVDDVAEALEWLLGKVSI